MKQSASCIQHVSERYLYPDQLTTEITRAAPVAGLSGFLTGWQYAGWSKIFLVPTRNK
jgi:hypothetical protein